MTNTDDLLQRCEELKDLIRNLKATTVDENSQTIKDIQLSHLRNQLSKVGRQLNELMRYKKDNYDR